MIRIIDIETVREAPNTTTDPACNSREAWRILSPFLQNKGEERFMALYLNAQNHPIMVREISRGSLTASIVHPREVFKAAILDNANAVIVAHNHPSGHLKPSPEDRAITRRLAEAGRILGIQVLDHLIITDGADYYSFADDGKIGEAELNPTPHSQASFEDPNE